MKKNNFISVISALFLLFLETVSFAGDKDIYPEGITTSDALKDFNEKKSDS